MKLLEIQAETVLIPLKQPFKTALRSVDCIENICVRITTDTGHTGLGGAAPTAAITGETVPSILGALKHINDSLSGMNIEDAEIIFQKLNACMIGNHSAKAAADMAVYDLLGKQYGLPLFRLLGGTAGPLETDMTICLDSVEKMVLDSLEKAGQGFGILKLKVGNDPALDIRRLMAVRKAVGPDIKLRIDANQGWKPKEAVVVVNRLIKEHVDIELIEQPVPAGDYAGMRFVRDRVDIPVIADESVFTPADALRLIEMKAADGINIKLMKCGGIFNALKIAAIAESAGLTCMMGSMMESSLSVTAAAHLACSRNVIGACDLDAPLFCSVNPVRGGIHYRASTLTLPDGPGLGIGSIRSDSHPDTLSVF
ncbi:MAG: dipeptide epimerase [Deltaproteobacteria bacterium]|nr:dipeptide epimerase [Deltaproteobacteria bacterium]